MEVGSDPVRRSSAELAVTPGINLNDAVVFIAVGELASFSAAAKQLGITRSAVTRAIAKLEKSLSTRLLVRTTRHVSLTTAGREFGDRIRTPIESLSGVWREFSSRNGQLVGRIRVGATPDAAAMPLAPTIKRFVQENPGVRLDLGLTQVPGGTATEAFDVILGFSSPEASNLERRSSSCRPIGHAVCQLFAAPSYLEQHGTPEHPSEMHRHTALSPPNGSALQEMSNTAVLSRCSKYPIACGDLLVVREFIRLGCGLGFLPRSLAEDDVARAWLVPILAESVAVRLTLALSLLDGPHLSGVTGAFCDFIVADLRQRKVIED